MYRTAAVFLLLLGFLGFFVWLCIRIAKKILKVPQNTLNLSTADWLYQNMNFTSVEFLSSEWIILINLYPSFLSLVTFLDFSKMEINFSFCFSTRGSWHYQNISFVWHHHQHILEWTSEAKWTSWIHPLSNLCQFIASCPSNTFAKKWIFKWDACLVYQWAPAWNK